MFPRRPDWILTEKIRDLTGLSERHAGEAAILSRRIDLAMVASAYQQLALEPDRLPDWLQTGAYRAPSPKRTQARASQLSQLLKDIYTD